MQIQNTDEAIQEWFDDSTLDERETAGLKSLVDPGELELWFGEMCEASQTNVLNHLRQSDLAMLY